MIEFGFKSGLLTVIAPAGRKRCGRQMRHTSWCLCECGNIVVIRDDTLKRVSAVRSCGCKRFEHLRTHGLSDNELYGTFQQMHARCEDSNHTNYLNYGGRGIRVCEEWSGESGLENFLKDMAPRPEGYTLERIDPDLGYSKENCCWATASSQKKNRRKFKGSSSEFKGVSKAKGRFQVTLSLGSFESEEEAARAYDDASEKLFGTRPNATTKVENLIGDYHYSPN